MYPWRASRDPYAVLVSEIMLQQTQAARVVPVFVRFLGAFPSVASLAAAGRGDVVRAWAGLGYNRRAVALSEAARAIVRDHDGRVPADPQVLRTLPGVGPYTAAAVAALAFGAPVAAVDTNGAGSSRGSTSAWTRARFLRPASESSPRRGWIQEIRGHGTRR